MSEEIYDVAVIGSGPAGMTAGLYAARAGLNVAVFERVMPGGQLGNTDVIENYPGFVDGIGGFDLAFAIKQQAERFGTKILSEEVTSLELEGERKIIRTSSGEHAARSIIVATGARPRKLGVAREDELTGRGVSYCATCDGNFFRGKDVLVIGGANTAAEDAVYLSRICNSVAIVYRRGALRATKVYADAAYAAENITCEWFSVVDELHESDGKVSGARIRNVNTGEVKDLACDAVFVAVGSVPNTELLAGALELDEAGYIVADETCATSIPGVFAAGDVRTKPLRQVVTAVSDGAVAAEQAAAGLSS